MIQKFVDRFMAKKGKIEQQFSDKLPEGYGDIVKAVMEILADEEDYGESPDPTRITAIDDGDYQGVLVYVIGANGYEPSTYWYVRIYYGSCSGCDTLEAIRSESYDDKPTASQVQQCMTLALHIVQRMKQMDDEAV